MYNNFMTIQFCLDYKKEHNQVEYSDLQCNRKSHSAQQNTAMRQGCGKVRPYA
jgi:hypothetical protein